MTGSGAHFCAADAAWTRAGTLIVSSWLLLKFVT
jgi:hypothetical protein